MPPLLVMTLWVKNLWVRHVSLPNCKSLWCIALPYRCANYFWQYQVLMTKVCFDLHFIWGFIIIIIYYSMGCSSSKSTRIIKNRKIKRIVKSSQVLKVSKRSLSFDYPNNDGKFIVYVEVPSFIIDDPPKH